MVLVVLLGVSVMCKAVCRSNRTNGRRMLNDQLGSFEIAKRAPETSTSSQRPQ